MFFALIICELKQSIIQVDDDGWMDPCCAAEFNLFSFSLSQPARHSKLEKADILEMTVKYLQNHQINLQRQQAAISQATDATIATKFKAGFSECANEVGRFPGMEPQVKRRLLQHLSSCMNGERQEQHVQVHMLPSPPSSPEQDSMSHITSTSNGYYLTNGAGSGVQLIPTKLPNGNIAFVLPQSPASSQIPMLVPIPSRTASTGSATSSSYERMREQSTSPYNAPPSPANSSYEPMDCMPAHQSQHSLHQQQLNLLHQQQQQLLQQQRSFSPSAPISLVMRKTNFDEQMKDDEKPWRPW
jgi:hairy-and-enhancer-of-split protein